MLLSWALCLPFCVFKVLITHVDSPPPGSAGPELKGVLATTNSIVIPIIPFSCWILQPSLLLQGVCM